MSNIQKGDKVYFDKYHYQGFDKEADLIRTVISVQTMDGIVRISADGGPACPTCGKPQGRQTPLVLASLYSKVPACLLKE